MPAVSASYVHHLVPLRLRVWAWGSPAQDGVLRRAQPAQTCVYAAKGPSQGSAQRCGTRRTLQPTLQRSSEQLHVPSHPENAPQAVNA